MATVTVTYNAWDHNAQIIPANLQPQVGFRPLSTSQARGLMTNREVWGSGPIGPSGTGSVELESAPDLMYVPFMRWLIDASQISESVQNRAYGYCEWDPIYPADGGPISGLPGVVKLSGIWYGFGAPPLVIKNRNDSIYLDITGPGVGIWAPARAAFPEGVVI